MERKLVAYALRSVLWPVCLTLMENTTTRPIANCDLRHALQSQMNITFDRHRRPKGVVSAHKDFFCSNQTDLGRSFQIMLGSLLAFALVRMLKKW